MSPLLPRRTVFNQLRPGRRRRGIRDAPYCMECLVSDMTAEPALRLLVAQALMSRVQRVLMWLASYPKRSTPLYTLNTRSLPPPTSTGPASELADGGEPCEVMSIGELRQYGGGHHAVQQCAI